MRLKDKEGRADERKQEQIKSGDERRGNKERNEER